MTGSRSPLAEQQHRHAVAERRRRRAAAATRERAARQKITEFERASAEARREIARAEQAKANAQRGQTQAANQQLREAKQRHVKMREGKAQARSSLVELLVADLDSVLAESLAVDDHVDLDRLRVTVQHPPFQCAHETPEQPPVPLQAPREPVFVPPKRGIGGYLAPAKYAQRVKDAEARFAGREHARWREHVASLPTRQLQQLQEHQAREQQRLAALAHVRDRYARESEERESEVARQNAPLDELIVGLREGRQQAVEEYVRIVLANSAYPDGFDVTEEVSFDPTAGELILRLNLPDPSTFPRVKQFRYVKAGDEIAVSERTAKDIRDRYRRFVESVLLRTLHEVFEAERDGHVGMIALTAVVSHLDPALGKPAVTPIAAVAATREEFQQINLAKVTPIETLRHLKAVISKSPADLTPIERSPGVQK